MTRKKRKGGGQRNGNNKRGRKTTNHHRGEGPRYWIARCRDENPDQAEVFLSISRVQLFDNHRRPGATTNGAAAAAAAAAVEPTAEDTLTKNYNDNKNDSNENNDEKETDEDQPAIPVAACAVNQGPQKLDPTDDTATTPNEDGDEDVEGTSLEKLPPSELPSCPGPKSDKEDDREGVPHDKEDQSALTHPVEDSKVGLVANGSSKKTRVRIKLAPTAKIPFTIPPHDGRKDLPNGDCGDGIVNPYDPQIVDHKYWAQRKRLFSRFDEGIRMDPEAWFSVTPEAIANHIAQRMVEMGKMGELATDDEHQQSKSSLVVLDPFAGVGGNSVALALRPEVSLVVCADTNRERLKMAAHNCAIYQIDPTKVIFLHSDACSVLECYKGGRRMDNEPEGRPREGSATEALCSGYRLGGMDVLPDKIDLIFLSPPWGGSNYEKIGPENFDLSCISLVHEMKPALSTELDASTKVVSSDTSEASGEDILRLAVNALKVSETPSIAYFLPRNSNGYRIAKAAFRTGKAKVEMEQNYLNGKLKTITMYT